MTTIKKYQVYCTTESLHYTTWSDSVPTVCPNNAAHSIDTNATIITETISSQSSLIKAKTFNSSTYSDLNLDAENNLQISLSDPLTSFGSVAVENSYPTIQIDGDALRESDVTYVVKNGGDVTTESGLFCCETGVTEGFAKLKSRRRHKYRPAQGTKAFFTAIYSPGITGSIQMVGLTSDFSSLDFGYEGVDFGIKHSHDGMKEVRELELDVGVTTGNTTLNLVLNDDTYSIPLTAGKTPEYNCWEIEKFMHNDSQYDWKVCQSENTVIIEGDFCNVRSGTYTSNLGTLSQLKEGVSTTKTFIKQQDWNIDLMDGTGPSGMILNPLTGNVYKIQIQYLGFGNTRCYIEHEITGKFVLVHVIRWSNNNVLPIFTMPSFCSRMFCKSGGESVGNNIKLQVCCMAIFNEGIPKYRRDPRSFSVTKVGIDEETINLITFRNRCFFQNCVNVNQLKPQFISISNISADTSNTVIHIIRNIKFDSFTEYNYLDYNNSMVEYNIESNTLNSLQDINIISTYNLGSQSSYTINLDNITVGPNECLAIIGSTNHGTAELSVSLTWIED